MLRFVAAFVLLAAAPALADCGVAPAGDAALLATPRGAAAVADARTRLTNPEGRLWRVGTEPPSYLVGTFHIAAGGIEQPGPVLERLVADAAELFVEVDEAQLAATQAAWVKDPARMFRGPGDRLSDDMTAQERADAEALLAQYGMPFAMADQMRPLFLVGILSVPPCAVDLAATPGLDAALERIAHEHDVPVRALESVDEQLAALEGDPGELDATLRMMLTQARTYDEDWFLYLAMYRSEAVGALWSIGVRTMIDEIGEAEAMEVVDAFWERLVAARNRRMAERMLPALREGNRVVAVGALHLPGEDGLVDLLSDAGLTVERMDDGVPPHDGPEPTPPQ